MKKHVSFLLAIIMLLSLIATPAAAAAPEGVNGEAQITRRNDTGTSYDTYNKRSVADQHQITIYAKEPDFPITVKMRPFGCSSSTSKITTYGIHRESWENFFGHRTYITIVVKSYPAVPSQPVKPKSPTKEEILEQKAEKLVKALDLPCRYYSIDTCQYTREVKAFISGEWDGSRREGDDWGSYQAYRYVMSRTYYWIGTNLITDESYSLSANVDYDGYKDVIPGRTTGQDYSLAVSYVNGEIEKWSSLEKQDAWKLTQIADGSEKIDTIIPLATSTSGKDDCQVYVSTTDANEQQHMYSLMPNGKVVKMS